MGVCGTGEGCMLRSEERRVFNTVGVSAGVGVWVCGRVKVCWCVGVLVLHGVLEFVGVCWCVGVLVCELV